ncbi:hypothetical protein WSK_2876 [Novosphingobium sp. Rr 2-17]|nr:hypothetical protein WSK_2876 [Novosphingobium sp. Rr 2-17]
MVDVVGKSHFKGLVLLAAGGALGAAAASFLQPVPAMLDAVFTPAAAQVATSPECSAEQEKRNVAIVTAAASARPGAPGGLNSITAADYVQHNPEIVRFAQVNNVTTAQAMQMLGKLGPQVRGMMRRPMAPVPGRPADNLTYKVLAQCDTVVAVGQHWHEVPGAPGQYYATYFFNMWRMEDGKLVEHWDPDDLPTPLPDYLKIPVSQLKLPPAPDLPPPPG